MKEVELNVFEHLQDFDVLCVTTNGIVKRDGTAVMGRGIARAAAYRWDYLPNALGTILTQKGNHVALMGVALPRPTETKLWLVSFPTKNHWRDKSDIELITRSTWELVALVDSQNFQRVALPRPGCSNGGLAWEAVKPVIEPLLDDRFTIISFSE